MTIEQILDCPAEDLEKISDEQYLKWFTELGYLNVTRPELAPRKSSVAAQTPLDFATQNKLKQLSAAGIDLSWIHKKKK